MTHRFPLIALLFVLLFTAACSDVQEASDSYMEYPFDSGEDMDMGFTHRAFERLEEEGALLSGGSSVIEEQMMRYQEVNEFKNGMRVQERRTWNDDTYELMMKGTTNMEEDTYEMMKNGELLFEELMAFGADGPVHDWRMVDDKPAFTFSRTANLNEIWYDGSLISEKFSVENPRYLFSYNGALGFVATHDGMDSIFYDGHFITPGFTSIWTQNCCSYTEILPTVYENGTLLFYAKREGVNYLVETRFKEFK